MYLHTAQKYLLDCFCFNKENNFTLVSCFSSFLQCLDVVWRGARWIMDCLQCVRSKQWVGAVPLGLVMGGDPPPCSDGEEEDKRPSTRLKWANRMQTQRSVTGSAAARVCPSFYLHSSS